MFDFLKRKQKKSITIDDLLNESLKRKSLREAKRESKPETPLTPEVEKLIEQAAREARNNLERKKVPKSLGYCHDVWAEQKRILREKYNIEWKTPAERYPNYKFD